MLKFNAELLSLSPLDIKGFKSLDLEYWLSPNEFGSLIENVPSLENIKLQIESKKKNYNNREEIANILLDQHLDSEFLNKVPLIQRIKNENTFSIICAHQPLLLGGHLYWWYKIIHCLTLQKELVQMYPEYDFLVIYYSGTEDHDFEEIQKIKVFQEELVWNSNQEGANGRKNCQDIIPILNQLKLLFQNNENAIACIDSYTKYVESSKDYNQFYQKFFYSIFGSYDILYFNPDDAKAKKLAIPYFHKEIQQGIIKSYSEEAERIIKSKKHTPQAHTHDLNLFYLQDNYRVLIQKSEGMFVTKDKRFNWTKEQIENELQQAPENFSPNVVARPIYQEYLFPNVVFVGGGAEVSYWLQLKNVFELLNISYPILWRRFSAIHYPISVVEKIQTLDLQLLDFLMPIENIVSQYLKNNSDFLDKYSSTEASVLKEIDNLTQITNKLDNSTQNSIASDIIRIKQSLEHIKGKVEKAEKSKSEISIRKIEKVKELLFPNLSLQERHENGLSYYLKFGPSFIEFLIKHYKTEIKAMAIIEKTNSSE
ncbi:MAG: bacillithiol biosynthesis cysteine-adding enzyme BshC [Saprospiraceae bacterium]|nr:bacillithiol biosynthesis cysteine-adding enzyme BshC [Saprospiraceae bacterium]